jgi:exonuclease SbcC
LIIIGPNGAGKSSIIDAIFYSLCGVQVRGDNVNDLIREGATKAKVTLNFDHNGINYEVERGRTRTKSPTAKLKKNKTQLAQMQTAVSSEITNILGMDKDAIINSVFIRQGEITSLIDGIPSERKNIMAKLLGIQKLETCFNKMKKVIVHFEKEIEQEKVIEAKVEENLKVKTEIETEIKNIEQSIEDTKKQVEKDEKNFQKAEENKTVWEAKEKEFQNLEKERVKKEEQIKAKNKQINDTKVQVDIAKKSKEKAQSVESKIKEIGIIENYSKLLLEKTDNEKDHKTLTNEINRVKKRKKILDENKSVYDNYTANEKKIKKKKVESEKLNPVQLELTEIQTDIKNYEKNKANLLKENKKIAERAKSFLTQLEVKAKEEKIEEIESQIDEIVKKNDDLKELTGSMRGRLSEIEENMNILESNKTPVCPVCSKKLTQEHKEKVILDFKNEKQEKTKGIKKNEKDLKKLGSDEKQLRTLLKKITSLDIERFQEILSEEAILMDEINKLKEEEALKRPKLELLNKLKKEINDNEDFNENLKAGYNKYITAKDGLEDERNYENIQEDITNNKKITTKINQNLSKITKQLEVLPEDPEKELDELRNLNEKYVVWKEQGEQLEPFNKILTKYEKELADLSDIFEGIKRNLISIEYNEDIFKTIKKNYEDKNNNLRSSKQKMSGENESLKKENARLKKKKEEISKIKSELANFSKTKKFLELLRDIKRAFSRDGLQRSIRKVFAPRITTFAKQYLEMFNININDISVDEDLDISVLGRTGKISINSISGGEKVAVAIILRLAIAKLLSGQVATVIMDEPTTHLDTERRKELVDAMKSFKKESYSIPQIIVVSHHEELVEIADTIFEVKMEDGSSKVNELTSLDINI